jgi:hypothetical protein
VSLRRSPPWYPDAVTLCPEASPRDVLAHVDGSPGCSVKDSFATLDLVPAGFRVLFDATWIWLAPDASPSVGGPLWQAIADRDELVEWGAAHGGGELFRPGLLDHPAATVLAQREDGALVAGAVINLSEGAVGLSNVFGGGGDVWARAVASVRVRYPGLAVVGYESGAALDAARAAGFVATGPLRVWMLD